VPDVVRAASRMRRLPIRARVGHGGVITSPVALPWRDEPVLE